MSKIFEFNANKGSYLENVSCTVMTHTNTSFSKTEKGYSLLCNDTNSRVVCAGDCLGDSEKTYVVYIKPNADTTTNNEILSNDKVILTYWSNNRILYTSDGGTLHVSAINSLTPGIWHIIIITVTSNGITNIYIGTDKIHIAKSGLSDQFSGTPQVSPFDTELGFRTNSYINNVTVHDKIFTTQEINTAYKDFLRSKGTGSSIFTKDHPNKPTDLSYVNGLLAAYSMLRSPNNILTDVSGNNNNLSIRNCISTKRGLSFNGTTSDLFNTSSNSLPTAVGTALFQMKYNNLSGSQTYFDMDDSAGSDRILMYSDGFNLNLYINNVFVAYKPLSDIFIPDIFYSVAVIWDTITNFYTICINGVNINPITSTTTEVTDVNRISVGTYFNGEINNVKFYNKILSEEEIKKEHNFFVSPVIVEDFQNEPVGNFPREWQEGIGSYEVKEDTTGDKYLECTSNGVAYIQSKNIYGEYEFDICKKTSGTSYSISFISDKNDTTVASVANKYQIDSLSNENLRLNRGGTINLFTTNSNYIEANTVYTIKITRSVDGEFTCFIRGGNFGNTYTIIDTIGGSGSNPIIDNTYTSSNYFVVDLDTGDLIDNIKITNGITH